MANSTGNLWGGRAALAGIATFIVSVIALHLLQPEYDPASQLMSELALGPYGGWMFAAFFGLAVAVFGIQAAIGSAGATPGLRSLLAAAALFFLAAGVFPLGAFSEMHIAAIAMAFMLTVLAMFCFPAGAGSAATAAPRAVSWSLAAGVVAGIALGHSVLPMGVGQRLAAACLLVWLTILGWSFRR